MDTEQLLEYTASGLGPALFIVWFVALITIIVADADMSPLEIVAIVALVIGGIVTAIAALFIFATIVGYLLDDFRDDLERWIDRG